MNLLWNDSHTYNTIMLLTITYLCGCDLKSVSVRGKDLYEIVVFAPNPTGSQLETLDFMGGNDMTYWEHMAFILCPLAMGL